MAENNTQLLSVDIAPEREKELLKRIERLEIEKGTLNLKIDDLQ